MSVNKYALSYAGTDGLKDLGDIKANFQQAFGVKNAQYEQAMTLAGKVAEKVGNTNLVLTGHSLGGGLASAAAIRTGIKAETFNAAGLNSRTVKRHGLKLDNAKNLITAHFTSGDPLSKLQDLPWWAGGLGLLSSASGTRNKIGSGGHSIIDVCKTLGTNC